MKWINRFIQISDNEVMGEFECRCRPSSNAHERMISGALRNMGDHCYLDDGIPVEPTE